MPRSSSSDARWSFPTSRNSATRVPCVQGDGELRPEPLVRAFSPAGPVLSRSRVGKAYISRIEARVTSCKALFFLQSLPWLATCNFHQFLACGASRYLPRVVKLREGDP